MTLRAQHGRRLCAMFLLAAWLPQAVLGQVTIMEMNWIEYSPQSTAESYLPPPAVYPDHRMVERVNANGRVFHWDYHRTRGGARAHGSGMFIEPEYYQVKLDYPDTNRTVVTYKRGETDQVYDYYHDYVIKRVTRLVGPDGTNSVERWQRDSDMNVTNHTITDHSVGEYLTTVSTYDDNHNVTSEGFGYCSRPAATWNYTWHDDYQTLTGVTDPEGHAVQFQYTNALLSKIALVLDSNLTHDTTFAYDGEGLLVAITNANGHWVRFAHDSLGYVTNVTPEAGPAIGLEHDVLGYVDKIRMPGESGTRTVDLDVDERGRVTSITYPDNLTETFTYDGYGNLLTNVDTAGREVVYTHVLGRLACITRTLEGATNQAVTLSFDYDQQLNVLEITDPLGRAVETYQLDLADRVTSVVNVESQEMTLARGVGDYINAITRFDGSEVDFTYNADGYLSEVAHPDATDSYGYLANGLLETAGNEAGIVSNEYDAINRLVSSSGPGPGGAVEYSYYPAGQISNVSFVAGNVGYVNDAAERVAQISSPEGTFAHAYDAYNGGVAVVTNTDSGLAVSYDYDLVDRVTNIEWRDGSSTVLESFAYSYDDAGMITNVVHAGGGRTEYTYDSLDRLVGEARYDSTNGAVYEKLYEHDLAGNRTAMIEDGLTNNYALGVGNRLASWGTSSWMKHDAAGNATSIYYSASHRLDLGWNDRYQVMSVTTNGVEAESYTYDALGRRTSTTDGTATRHLIFGAIHVIAETDENGALQKSYTWGPGIDNLLAYTDYAGGQTNTYYALTDHLGTVHALADESGEIVESYRFDAWGRVLGVYDGDGTPLEESAVGNHYLWQGRWYSWNTGFYYFRARWYDPITGRWLSKDPIGIAGGLNQYVAFKNSPVNFNDPFGLLTGEEIKDLQEFLAGQERILGAYKNVAKGDENYKRFVELRKKTTTIANAAGQRSDFYKNAPPEVQNIIDVHESYHQWHPEFLMTGILYLVSPDAFARFMAREEIRAHNISNRLLRELLEKELNKHREMYPDKKEK